MCGSLFLGLLAVLFPPLPVWIKRGICSVDGLINIALCCLGFIPGLIHAWYIIAKYPEETYGQYQSIDSESGGNARVYVYTATYPSAAAHAQPKYAPQNQSKKALNVPKTGPQHYGTTSSNVAPPNNESASAANGPQFLPNDEHAGGVGSSSQQPPSYHDAVKGDFKVQTSD